MARLRGLVLATLLFAMPSAALGPAPDIAGSWLLTVDFPAQSCVFTGPLSLTQDGTMFEGEANVVLTTGTSPPCLPGFGGTISGTTFAFQIQFGVATGGPGTASFDGDVAADQKSMSGTWTLGAASGTWSAERADISAAPAAGAAGMALLFAALAAAGTRRLRRTKPIRIPVG